MRCLTFKRFLIISFTLLSSISIITYTILTRDLPYPTGRPPDIAHYKYTINADVCAASTDEILGVLVVISHVGDVEARRTLREAFSRVELRRLQLRRVFLIGVLNHDREGDSSYNAVPQKTILEESETYHDIVQVNLIESYFALTFKSLLALQWGSNHCNNSKIIIKIDDDAIVDIHQMSNFLRTLSKSDVDKLIGRKERDGVPFLLGLMYMTSPSTAARLVAASRELPQHSHEDIYVTGYLAKYAGVGKLGIGGMITATSDLRCCKAGEIVYQCGYMVGQRRGHGVGGDYQLQGKVHKHSEYCYKTNKCWEYSVLRDLLARYVVKNYLQCITALDIER